MAVPRQLPARAPLITLGIVAILAAMFILSSNTGSPLPSISPSMPVPMTPGASVAASPPAPTVAPSSGTQPTGVPSPATTTIPGPTDAPLPTSGPTPRPGLDGTWIGTWRVTEPEILEGDLTIAFEESGGSLIGQVTMGETCLGSGALFGAAGGNDVAFTIRQREVTLAFVGTRSGSTIAGTFEATGCSYAEGTWEVTRT